jgi:hypothetical protein
MFGKLGGYNMAKTTFSGPVISKNGFQNTGPGMTVSLTADTTLTVASHAGKILLTNDADGKFYFTKYQCK